MKHNNSEGFKLICIFCYWTQTKFPIHKVPVWWLREAGQIVPTFIHSKAEFQSIRQ